MCFSATASFSAGAVLLGIGTLTLKSARHPREWLFAAIPAVSDPTVERRRDLADLSLRSATAQHGEPDKTPWLIAPAVLVLSISLFFVPRTSAFTEMLIVIGAVSASGGILSPILTYWISAKAGSAQGWELGKLTAAASLGVTVGSLAGGFLFNIAALPSASFVLIAGLVAFGFLLSLGLPHLLVPVVLQRHLQPLRHDTEPS